MFAKLVVLILGVGVIGCTLLGVRQQRLEAVHQMAVAQRNLMGQPKALAKLRSEIAQLSEPARIGELAALKVGPMMALGVHGQTPVSADGTAIVRDTTEPAARPRRNRP